VTTKTDVLNVGGFYRSVNSMLTITIPQMATSGTYLALKLSFTSAAEKSFGVSLVPNIGRKGGNG